MERKPLEERIREAARRLAIDFEGIFGVEAIERFTLEAAESFKATTVDEFIPLFVYRFARERLRALGQAEGTVSKDQPEVLFVCVHNAGRSQMAAVLTNALSDGKVHVRSAGSTPANEINPQVIEAVTELGLDLSQEFPKPLTDEVVRAADVVITMGCGDACPIYPGKRYLDWDVEDPSGKDLETVRRIREEIADRVRGLLSELDVESVPLGHN